MLLLQYFYGILFRNYAFLNKLWLFQNLKSPVKNYFSRKISKRCIGRRKLKWRSFSNAVCTDKLTTQKWPIHYCKRRCGRVYWSYWPRWDCFSILPLVVYVDGRPKRSRKALEDSGTRWKGSRIACVTGKNNIPNHKKSTLVLSNAELTRFKYNANWRENYSPKRKLSRTRETTN